MPFGRGIKRLTAYDRRERRKGSCRRRRDRHDMSLKGGVIGGFGPDRFDPIDISNAGYHP